jgi:ribonuclease HII
MLQTIYDSQYKIEIGIDEAGRGPLFGRLYVAAVILPKIESTEETLEIPRKKKIKNYNWSDIKDSKKIKSKDKMKLCAEFIQQNAIGYSVKFIEADRIDEINIRQAVFEGMHACVRECVEQEKHKDQIKETFLLIDGNDFKPFRTYISETDEIFTLPYKTIEGGDNKYLAIAAASVLAKHARDSYIQELCLQNPLLDEKYGLNKNMGYGTKTHLEGIVKYGITKWHRKTYGICKDKEVTSSS